MSDQDDRKRRLFGMEAMAETFTRELRPMNLHPDETLHQATLALMARDKRLREDHQCNMRVDGLCSYCGTAMDMDRYRRKWRAKR